MMSDEDLEKKINEIEDQVTKIQSSYWKLLSLLEERVDKAEATVAQIVPTLLEISGQVQAIVIYLADNSPEKQEELSKAIKETQQQFLKILSDLNG